MEASQQHGSGGYHDCAARGRPENSTNVYIVAHHMKIMLLSVIQLELQPEFPTERY